MSPQTRKTLQITGIVGLAVGGALTLTGVVLFVSNLMAMGGSASPSGNGLASGVVGMALFGAGGFVSVGAFGLLGFAFRKPLSELAATDTEVAVEHSAGALARGIRGGGLGGAIVKIKCRSCGYLDSEDAKFCSGCAATL